MNTGPIDRNAVFDELVGILLGDLYAAFPSRIHFSQRQVATRLSVPVTIHEASSNMTGRKTDLRIEIDGICKDFRSYLDDTLVYLAREGFIAREEGKSHQLSPGRAIFRSPDRIQLTSKGHKLLRAIPKSLDTSDTLGDSLNKNVAEVGRETRGAIISELTGLLLGAAAKGFSA